jgi:hypothetical protein
VNSSSRSSKSVVISRKETSRGSHTASACRMRNKYRATRGRGWGRERRNRVGGNYDACNDRAVLMTGGLARDRRDKSMASESGKLAADGKNATATAAAPGASRKDEID